MNYYAGSAFFNGLVALIISAYVVLRNPKDPLNRSFLNLGLAIGGWSLFYSFWCLAKDADMAFTLVKIHMSICAFIYSTLFHFVVNFTNQYSKFKFFVYIFYLLSCFFSICCHNGWLITGVHEILFFPYWPTAGPILYFHVACVSAIVLFSLSLIIIKIFNSSGDERIKSIWILVALMIGFGGGFVNWFLWFDILIPPVTNGFVGVHFLIIGYVIIRYRLMDVDVMVDLLRANRNAHLGMMSASINHEIKSPLFVMQGLAQSYTSNLDDQIYKDKEQTETALREMCHKVEKEVVKVQAIIQQFYEFSKLSQQNKISETKVDLTKLIRKVTTLLEVHYYAGKIRYEFENSQSYFILANPQHLEEIFYNLLSNATQAFKGSEGIVKISIKNDNGKIEILIQDNGPGIRKKQLEKIFEPFYTTKEEGTGLGLYITKQLVERNGGKITVESKEGKGTTFKIELLRA